ncbi:hypothetical protein CEUSTIGMA_g302.t1 [Chlamydomonas eustigma]|uniref:Serine aminopeptidase S33 domain-containing protein n=1 Tax=Chlamydomonas eustigma TaxID=1157962 RepID=A0A250WPS4_9CHLO|nr:hypothetical protein CEUSTIGMA_g302.t1 [Chlamydomonas eustigma]|eukprot:GAX72847.1 hypothetical protein CEUSTIGMA_g302.t1 [Chlamydomonas eustigma]
MLGSSSSSLSATFLLMSVECYFFQHGFGEYVGRYCTFFEELSSKANIAIYSFDMHGHGRSEPKEEKSRAFVEHFEDLVDDASQCLDIIKQSQPMGIPLLVGGQSLGGLLALHLLLKRQKDFSGLILHSAALDVEWTPVLRWCQASIGDCLAGMCPYAKMVPAVRPQDMCEDPAVVEEYLKDPMIYQGNVKANTGNEILNGFKKTANPALQRQVTVPIYACHGTSDRTTSLPAVRRFLKEAASPDKTLNEVKGGYHELFWGPQKESVRASLVAWIVSHVSRGATESAIQVEV